MISAATLAVVWIAYTLVPYLPGPAEVASDGMGATPGPPTLDRSERFELAMVQAIGVVPLFVLFHLFEWTGGILVLVFVALLSTQPGSAHNTQLSGRRRRSK